MFGHKKDPGSRIPIQTLIAAETTISGDVSFRGGLRIDGRVEGNVVAHGEESLLVVSESGRIVGRVQADHIVIDGQIEGPVECARLIELHPKGKIMGDVRYRGLEMHQGAVVIGQLQAMDQSTLTADAADTRLNDSNG